MDDIVFRPLRILKHISKRMRNLGSSIIKHRLQKSTDPRVRELADNIIEAQVREIAEMKGLIKDFASSR